MLKRDRLGSETGGWLAGLRDPIVGRALTTLHERASYPWTLARLAKQAGASRSTLAARFAHFVGQPPMQYLTRWLVTRSQPPACLCHGLRN